MAPPGRRKISFLNFLPFLILLVFSTSAQAASAVLGIDLGTEYIKAAIAKPGSPIDIVLTKDSKRKEAAALAFKPSRTQVNDPDAFPERLYGGDALALSARYPSDVFVNLKSILGLPVDSNEVKNYLARYPSLQEKSVPRISEDGSKSSVGFTSQNVNKDGTFMVEELLAMELKNIKANAEAVVGSGSVVTDVVITYPAYYTIEERRAIELSAELAGLRVLGLISDGLAVGLNYATSRTFDSINEGGKPEYHIVYDMGAGSTTATILRFQGVTIKGPGKKNSTVQEVQVMGTGADRTFGGDVLNDLVVTDMINKFLDTPRMKPYKLPSIQVRKHGKTMARLWKDAEKVRQVLSANSKAFATLEGLFYEDVTFKYSLTREEFEILTQNHVSRVATPLKEALSMAGLQLDDIDSIILHGGTIRTPFVQKQLEQVAGGPDKIKTNVNADEAAVMGAAFKAASISPLFRVKTIRDIEIAGSAYTMSWSVDGKPKEQKVFVPTSQFGVEKQITVKTLQDLSVDFNLDATGQSTNILSVDFTNLTKSVNDLKDKYDCATTNISTVFTVRLHPTNGAPELMSGRVSCKGQKNKEGGVIDGVKGLFGFGSKKDQDPLKAGDEENSSASTPLPISDPTSSGTIVSAASTTGSSVSGAASTTASASTKVKPSIVTIPLAFKTTIKGLNQPPAEQLPTIKQRLIKFDSSDKNSVLRSEALNVLEAYTYRARDYLDDESFIAVSTDKVRKELEKQLSSVSEWLYSEGVDAKIEEFKAKLRGLQSIVDPALRRKDEGSKRASAIASLESSLSNASSMVDMIKESIEKAAKDAASSASSMASTVADKVSSAVTPSSTDGTELEDDPYGSDAAASPPEEEVEFSMPKPYEYTEDDLSSINKAYDTAKSWLEEKLALQAKLSPYDDPAVLVSEMESKADQLQKSVSSLIMKQVKMSQIPKPRKSKAAKKESSKTKKSKSSTATESSSTVTASTSVKDEL